MRAAIPFEFLACRLRLDLLGGQVKRSLPGTIVVERASTGLELLAALLRARSSGLRLSKTARTSLAWSTSSRHLTARY